MLYDKVIRAIRKINPNAEVIVTGEDLDSIEWLNTDPIPHADIEAQYDTVVAEYNAEVQAEADKKTSANNKLLGLGLTQEEVTALTGYKPAE
jgi:hypothetical protein